MGLITKTKTWVDDENVLYTDLNSDFDNLYNLVNGNIDNDNIAPDAAIAESKLEFSTSGHSHNGIDSKLISVTRAFSWYVSGNLATGTNFGPRYVVPQDMTIVKCWVIVRTAPNGASLTIDINKNGSTIWSNQANRPTISNPDTTTNTETFNETELTAGDYLDLDIDQVGSSTSGAELTIVLECTQP